MTDFLERTRQLLGDRVDLLIGARAAVFGLGGVGGHCAEALVRAGFGELILCDGDTVSDSNRNRQLLALTDTVGMSKTAAARQRFEKINPACKLRCLDCFIAPDTDFSFLQGCAYVADCIDDVRAKVALVCYCKKQGIPVLSALGCGNRICPEKLMFTDIFSTSGDPLARAVRKKLREAGVKGLDVLVSTETPLPTEGAAPGSVSFVPGVAGMMMAGKIVRTVLDLDGSVSKA